MRCLMRYNWLLLVGMGVIRSQCVYQSLMLASDQGLQYSPANPSIQLLSTSFYLSWASCANACNNNHMCRIFDYGAIEPSQCRLFEGDLGVMGSLASSSLSDSRMGIVQLAPSLFAAFGQSCLSACEETRYLVCGAQGKCECLPHTYWNDTSGMCLTQLGVLGASCVQEMSICREDLNLTCSTTLHECRLPEILPLSTSIIVVNAWTPIQGSALDGLEYPVGVTVYDGDLGEELIIVDTIKNQLVHVSNIESMSRNVSLLIYNWNNGNQFFAPLYSFLDKAHQNNLYVSDALNARVMLFPSMQTISPPPQAVAGTPGASGVGLSALTAPAGIAVDSQQNLYIADTYNHRVVFWQPNSTFGILIAGTGSPANDSWSLNYPRGLFLLESRSILYVADSENHRIQSYALNGSPPYEGITVAGGGGVGAGNHQLNQPADVWVSRITGTIFIADTSNSRIQRWSPAATSGVTLAGDSNGVAGMSDARLSYPNGLTINRNETRLYVSDSGNQRVQRFDLV